MRNTDYRLPRSTPESQGISSAALLSFLDTIERDKLELHSLMVVRHGHVVAEGWWNPYGADLPHMLFSLSKSFTSTAVGLAVQEGLLSVDDKVVSFFPEVAPANPPANLAEMRVRHLLCMGTGHAEDTTERITKQEDKNWVKGFLGTTVEHPPGTHFVYNSGASYMLSAIVQKVTGQKLLDYLQPRLFRPLGIEGATWEMCPEGINTGGWGLSLRTEDIANFGQLYLQKGQWRGERILSEAWVDEATSSQISNGDGENIDWKQGYGYQFWRCQLRDIYRGDGAFGQYCIVMPEQDAVIAITSAVGNMQDVLNIVWERLLPAMEESSLPPDDKAASTLARDLNELAIHPPLLEAESPLSAEVTGKRYEFEKNMAEITALSFHFREGAVDITIEKDGGVHPISCGVNGWIEGTTRVNQGLESRVAASAAWREPNTLVLTIRLPETPFCHTFACMFTDDVLWLELSQNVGFGPDEHPVLIGKAR